MDNYKIPYYIKNLSKQVAETPLLAAGGFTLIEGAELQISSSGGSSVERPGIALEEGRFEGDFKLTEKNERQSSNGPASPKLHFIFL